ncbi:RDD family protein [Acetivibrio mesophilus]|uniref:RDD family protein n=1 Tax=Acetivibrio mesophilus TaxID=2487273 RepID=A0A4Q0I7C3_9FIRM|nr:RDD family protein [Acetivibrio mesophilus]RXE58902.1 RDD family protein [Acetivibrio mesophilus]
MSVSGSFRRCFAWFLDLFILAAFNYGMILVLNLLGIGVSFNEFLEAIVSGTEDSFGLIYDFILENWLIYGILFLIYEIAFVASSLSATPGKLILGIEVVSDSKGSILKVILRALVKLVDVITPVSIISIIMVLASRKRQSLHDKVAGTYVVYKKTNNNSSKRINTTELFEEMKRRGLRTYSEQQALAEELYGTGKKKSKKYRSYRWIGLVFLVIALILFGICSANYISIFESLILKQ